MDFKLMLAPLEDVSDNALRTLCFNHGADMTFTEMTRVEGLARKNAATWSRLDMHDDTPTIIQLLAAKEERLKRFLSMFEPKKCFKGFNFNVGCPSPDITSLGQGAAMVKRISKLNKLASIIRDAGYPISIKMRLGLNNFEKQKKAYLNTIKAVDADFFIVHARHGGQIYEELADWSVYPECVATGKDIYANGDIMAREGLERLKEMGVKGAMIGRAAVRNPAIFDHLKGKPVPSFEALQKEYIELADRFNAPFKYRKNVLWYLGTKKTEQQADAHISG
ncbi:MAG: tRNA-dihydrouridine synthase family protein [Nanoarchaeota archaeon]|nr:tRNA-dihydrouridine synthase family protein [Nanoarchaeota archaeon]